MAQAHYLNPTVPFVGAVISGSKNGSIVNIRGTSFLSSSEILIDFVTDNISTNIGLRVALDFDRNLIVRNSMMKGKIMGDEETHGPIVNLVRGQPFQLDIRCDINYYKIAFNGVYYTKMKHRIYKCLNDFYLAVWGDLKLYDVQINDLGVVLPGQIPIPRQLLIPERKHLSEEMAKPEQIPKPTIMSLFVPPGMDVGCVYLALDSDDTGNYALNMSSSSSRCRNSSSRSSSSSSSSSSSNSSDSQFSSGNDEIELLKTIKDYLNSLRK